ncbi:putative minus-end-directed kinesin ATPase [Medicago truncatula]|uniref:Kinesin-like protein n=1 Tax=Medicago truncatula TaxID=3880 RepID=G7JF36_MEDTR|nr:kinesin-like protein KIN-14N isoform X2 [Medicago truncatula]AES89902.2 kinesin motor catalytic domain protein [Medicago truncatula]RHN61941.1 putative minus-end-directed kinesin ATPase [Medicago truncatula]
MVTKIQNWPPLSLSHTSPTPSKNFVGDNNCLETMVETPINGRIRQALTVVNGGHDVGLSSAPPSNAGSDYGVIEFTREDVEALLNEKAKKKERFNYKERCENMVDYIKRLKVCIRWFQDLEMSYSIDQEKLKNSLEMTKQKSIEIEMLLKIKEEELNLIIIEMRKNCTSLQEKLIKEEAEKSAAVESLSKEREARLDIERSHTTLSEDLGKAEREIQSANQKISSLNEMYKRLQEYITSLQQYNGKLHTELSSVEDELKRVEKEKATAEENIAMLKGQLTLSISSQEEATKQKDDLASEVYSMRGELKQVRDDRDRQLSQAQSLDAEFMKLKESRENSCIELDSLTLKANELEEKSSLKENQIKALQEKLAAAEKKLQVTDVSVFETRTEFEGQQKLVDELQRRLEDSEYKLIEGERLRKKLHNTILELKGNIRVFCRVRPLLPDENRSTEGKIFSYPSSMETSGRGIDLAQNGQKHSFKFDKVFIQDISQEEVFVEVSQLVQSALDGYKVCIFAYGQTGSGKTYTMMGRPGHPDEKGLIPRSLEQIFQAKQSQQPQGWKYEMQVSMLEIYNETIRDLLSTNRSSSDVTRVENGTPGKQYTIKHDVNGNTHVSDLTVVDVHSAKEVAFLLNQAANSRSVGKTQMNEQSSRSHFVFTLRIYGVNESTDQQVQGVLNLIDLAGSERLSKSGSTGDRLRETQAINKSLSSLSDVIFALAKKEDHVPFRNSKLTYLLQPCLGGDSKTLMFVNISPDPSSVGESLCSLRFASRVNACEIGTPRRQTNGRATDSRLSYF